MFIKSVSIFLLTLFLWEYSNGQNKDTAKHKSDTIDVLHPKKEFVPLQPIRAADVMWQKRIWRIIDTRQRINEKLYYPIQGNSNRISLFELIKYEMLGGRLAAYAFNPTDLDDCFSRKLTQNEIQQQLYSVDTMQNENGAMTQVKNELTSDKIRGYMIKEDWIFEKNPSMLEIRIIAICPMSVTINKNTGEEDKISPPTGLFWVYFPQAAPFLAGVSAFNEKNDTAKRSFYDIFIKREFSSYIIQEGNITNGTINSYLKGNDAVLEGNKIHDKIQEMESDMWQY